MLSGMQLRHALANLGGVVGLVAVGCGSSGPVAQTSTGVATDKPAAPRDSNEIAIAPRTAPVPEAADPNERIAFVREGSVWIMEADGGNPEQLSVRATEAADEAPAISPRGEAVAYASSRGGSFQIYVMSLEELLPKPVTDGSGGGDRSPTWAPDGKRIAFVRGAPGEKRAIYIADLGASGGAMPAPELLVELDSDRTEHAGMPAWSPDGRTIAFSADRREGNGTALWAIDLDSKRLRRLTPARPGAWFLREVHPSWSPDGKRVAFASNRHVASGDHAEELDIYVIGADGSGLTRLTDDPAAATDPTFSPDGTRLYFASSRERQNAYEMELYVMAATGGKQRRLTRDERPQNSAPSAGRTK
jgi:Tol biopolymer transport system component